MWKFKYWHWVLLIIQKLKFAIGSMFGLQTMLKILQHMPDRQSNQPQLNNNLLPSLSKNQQFLLSKIQSSPMSASRTQVPMRRIQSNAMRSPSPDIANRNVIKDTQAPMGQVKKYLQKYSHSPMHKNNMSKSTRVVGTEQESEMEALRARVRELEGEVARLKMEREFMLKQTRKSTDLNGISRDIGKSYNASVSGTPKSSKENLDLEKMKDRLILMMEENSRIGNLLKDREAYIKQRQALTDRVNWENNLLRNQLEVYKKGDDRSPKSSVITVPYDKSNNVDISQQIALLRNYYQNQIEPLISRQQAEINNRIRIFEQKIIAIENDKPTLSIRNKKKSQILTTPTRVSQKQPAETTRTQQPPEYTTSGVQLPPSTRPFQSMTMRTTPKSSQISKSTEIRQMELALQRAQKESEDLRGRNVELEGQLRKLREDMGKDSYGFKLNQMLEEEKRKNQVLEEQLHNKSNDFFMLERESNTLKENYARQTEHTSKLKFRLENEVATYKKSLEQHEEKVHQYEEALNKINQKSQLLETRLREKQLELQLQRKKLQTEHQQLQSNIKKYYEDLLRNKDHALNEQLRQFLQMFSTMRKNILECNPDEFLTQTQSLLTEKSTVEKQIEFIQDQNLKIFNDLRSRLAQQQLLIIDLQKQNSLLVAQVRQNQVQRQKLRRAMEQFQHCQPTTTSNIKIQTNKSTVTTNRRMESACRLKNCVDETISTIIDIERQITEILDQGVQH